MNISSKYFSAWLNNKGNYGQDTLQKIQNHLDLNRKPCRVIEQFQVADESSAISEEKKTQMILPEPGIDKKTIRRIIQDEKPAHKPEFKQSQKKWENICKILSPEKLDKLIEFVSRPGLMDMLQGISSLMTSLANDIKNVEKNLPDLANLLRTVGYNPDIRSGNRFLVQTGDFIPFTGTFSSSETEDTILMIDELNRRFDLLSQIESHEKRLGIFRRLEVPFNRLLTSIQLASQQVPLKALELFRLQFEEFTKSEKNGKEVK